MTRQLRSSGFEHAGVVGFHHDAAVRAASGVKPTDNPIQLAEGTERTKRTLTRQSIHPPELGSL